jgi:hypothetical protein
MSAGAMAVYREATGGEDEDNQSWHDETFDTTVFQEASTYEMQANRYDVKLKEAGHYLALHNNLISADTGSNRTEHTARLTYNGADLDTGRGQGYNRMVGGCEEAYVSGAAILDIPTANQYLNCEMQNSSSTTTANATRRASLSGLQLLKLDDSWDYFRADAYHVSVFQDLGDIIAWHNIHEEDSGSFEMVDIQKRAITLKSDGAYLAVYTVCFLANSSPPERTCGYAFLSLGGVGQYIEHSYSYSYARQAQGCDLGVISGMCLIGSEIDNRLLRLETVSETGGAQIIEANTTIEVVKLPDNVLNILRISDALGGGSFDVTDEPFEYKDEQDDDSAFLHSSGGTSYNVHIQKPGAFLFMAGIHADRSAAGANRYNNIFRWRRNSTPQTYGNFGSYNRGDASSVSGGSHGILFPNLDVNDIITLARTDESTSSGTPPYTVMDKCGMCAIWLPSIFPQAGQGFFLQGGF